MTLQELRFIIALAREKHFRKASTACFVSQPTLSIAIGKLEKELGVQLFERHKNKVQISPIGKDIVDRAKRIISEVEALKQAVELKKDPLKGVFKLGAIFTVGPYLLPPLITQLNQLAPEMPIEIHEDFTFNLREKLLNGDLDAILISLPFTGNGILTHTLYTESFVVLMPTDHPLARYKTVPEKALLPHPILMLGEGHCFRDQVISSCPLCFAANRIQTTGVHWQTVAGGSLETIRHMVASKMGLTILPMSAANVSPYDAKILTTRPLRALNPRRKVALAWRSSFFRVPAIDALVQAASQLDP